MYIEDGNQLKKDDGSINLDNLVLSGTTIRKALEFQSPTHSFELDPMVLLTLEHLPGTIMDEEQLYEISLAIVPAVVAASASAPCSPASCSRSSLEEELVPFNLCNSPSTSNSMSTIYQQPATNSRACQRASQQIWPSIRDACANRTLSRSVSRPNMSLAAASE